jgi:hypothetical protein
MPFSHQVSFLLFLSSSLLHCVAFVPFHSRIRRITVSGYRDKNLFATVEGTNNFDADDVDSTIKQLKQSLIALSKSTKRGFFASLSQRAEAKDIIKNLALVNPTKEPAIAYYDGDTKSSAYGIKTPSIEGKWTLIYTNAPDITSLDPNTNLFPIKLPTSAKLGRIGQECDASKSTISNVIEWKRPDWLNNIATNSQNDDRILQKVVCEAKASPKEPNIVQLNLVGFELLGDTSSVQDKDGEKQSNTILSTIMKGPAELLQRNPIQLKGPLKAPFGRFEILFLDEQMRIIKTGQGYYAVNIRDDIWF